MLRGAARRVGAGDHSDLAELVKLRAELDAAIAAAVAGLRASGDSWGDVAQGLGTSRQAAQMRYGREAER
jgi:hypothetical protein